MSEAKKMIKKNFELSKKLNEKNNEIYTDIVVYLRVSSLEELEVEEIISDILEMFLRYQEQGIDVEEAIGSDYKAFCDSIIESVRSNTITSRKLWYYAQTIANGLFILLTIDLVLNYIPVAVNNKAIIDYSFKLSFLINSILIMVISFGIVKYVGKNSFNHSLTKKTKSKKADFLFGAGFAIVIGGIIIITYFLSSYKIFDINAYCIFAILGVYWLYKLVNMLKNKLA